MKQLCSANEVNQMVEKVREGVEKKLYAKNGPNTISTLAQILLPEEPNPEEKKKMDQHFVGLMDEMRDIIER